MTPSSSTLRSKFFEDVKNDIPKENEEENAINDVHIDENNQKRKTSDNMSQATCSLTPTMDPYSIPQAIKVLDSM
ncbi:hypothetical protein Goarm_012730 [Gossypium armourianum]|uniref:Uncharacterized protein n=1 Tax=Gossypium armourianum TaxID=34283 RepID=A0A7J9J0T1_9ROSI|nr:hypothetical protein [Gossypium armourianum]